MEPKDKYTYFLPGEIFYFISHERDQLINPAARGPERTRLIDAEMGPPESDPESHRSPNDKDDDNHGQSPKKYDDKIDELINWSNKVAESLKPNLTITRLKERELHFRGTLQADEPSKLKIEDPEWKNFDGKKSPKGQRRGAFALIPAKVSNPDGFVEPSDLAELVIKLDNARNEQPLQSDFTVRAVSPNWLSTPCSEMGGGGGPGGIPEPYKRKILWILQNFLHKLLPNLVDEPELELPPYLPVLPASKAGLQARLGQEGRGVTVAILDTAPSSHDMAAAYERHHKVDPKNQKKYEHDILIEGLLGPDSPLEVHYASQDDLLRMRSVHLKDHDYEMPDHGLFVAGLIYSLAKYANIHLYEVLNSQGVGDLLSIAKGLGEVLDRYSKDRLVVNMSVVLNIPRLDHKITDFDKAFLAKVIKDWELHKNERIEILTRDLLSPEGEEWLRRQAEVIEWLCDQLYFYNSRVIAAAGNGWKRADGQLRPASSYPAEFACVLGVAALPKGAEPDPTSQKYPVTSYSNVADAPPQDGVTTLGGEPGEGNGVLGVYIGKFPDMRYRLQQYPWIVRPLMWVVFAIKWCSIVGPKNQTDLAWWCGTSFAAPTIAGLAAAVLSDLPDGASTQDAIVTMYATSGIRQALTDHDEDGVEGVKQS